MASAPHDDDSVEEVELTTVIAAPASCLTRF